MSTKSSLSLISWRSECNELHIYNEMLDDNYYIEDENGRVKLPEALARKFSKIMEDIYN